MNIRNINQIRYLEIRTEDSLLIVKNKYMQDYILQPVTKKQKQKTNSNNFTLQGDKY